MAKVPLSYVSPVGLVYEALAMQDGARKRSRASWRATPVAATELIDKVLRHVYSYLDGENLAPDSGVHHLGHAKADLGVLLDALEQGTLIDDRPLMGTMSKVLEEYWTPVAIDYSRVMGG